MLRLWMTLCVAAACGCATVATQPSPDAPAQGREDDKSDKGAAAGDDACLALRDHIAEQTCHCGPFGVTDQCREAVMQKIRERNTSPEDCADLLARNVQVDCFGRMSFPGSK